MYDVGLCGEVYDGVVVLYCEGEVVGVSYVVVYEGDALWVVVG